MSNRTTSRRKSVSPPPMDNDALLEIRQSRPSDVPEMVEVWRRAHPKAAAYEAGQLRGQMAAFPEGHFVATIGGKPVGFAAAFRIDAATAFSPHSWEEITGAGYGVRHDGEGDWLYGLEIAVDPGFKRLKIDQRLAEARRTLAAGLGVKGELCVAEMPSLAKRLEAHPDPKSYFDAVGAGEVKDPTARQLLRAGFEAVAYLEGYRPESLARGPAVLMAWRNPDADSGAAAELRAGSQTVRVTTVQLQARPARDLDELVATVDYFIGVAAGYSSDFVLFPEWMALPRLAGEPERLGPEAAMALLCEETPEFVRRISEAAVRRNVNVIAGSHATRVDGQIQNIAYACLRDGTVHAQSKLHPTPDERTVWKIEGGHRLSAIETDCGPVAILVCYDSEFPELGRRVADEGARILFVPYCTDTRQGHLRVKICAQARAIENQMFVVTAGNVGNVANVDNMDVNYAQSAILTPCDFDFARDGVAAEASENVEMVVTADLDLAALARARAQGSVRNFRDRRFDLYRTVWRGE